MLPIRSLMRARAGIALCGVVLATAALPASASALSLTQIGGQSFDSPVYVTQPPNGGPILVVQQAGLIRAVTPGGGTRSLPFLDLRSRVQSGGERGLLSVAFPPNYRKTHLLYVYYTNGTGDIEVDEFEKKRGTLYRAKRSSRRKVLTISHREFANHNGGQLQFDGNNRLLIGTGDGGSGGDPHGNAQNKGSLLGKLLRIKPRRRNGHPYTIPSGNPYVGHKGRDEIFARGLRNPWRFSIDRVGSTEFIAIGDVGQNCEEEIDYETLGTARGANFGWNLFEGFRTYPGSVPSCGSAAGSQPNPPIFAYKRNSAAVTVPEPVGCSSGCAVVGGYVVRDTTPGLNLYGRYVYADTYTADVRSFVPSLGGASGDRPDVTVPGGFVSSFGRDRAGHIYVASLGSGNVFQLTP
jgi:glucose/arabinose dehydrogenase